MDTVTVTGATPAELPTGRQAARPPAADLPPAGDRADCVLCGDRTEYPAATKGATLCPVCAWQQAEREAACSC
jgi:hypothetical protein